MVKIYFLFFICLIFHSACAQQQEGFEHFITARGDQLFDGDKTFRFISYNIPNLLTVEDNMPFTETNAWRLPDSYEIQDALRTIKQVGGKVARTYVITVRRKNDDPRVDKFVDGPGQFNERAFLSMDTVITLANKIGVRLIIPFVDNWRWMGGKPQYAEFRGKNEEAFWTDEQIKDDFKKTIAFILNRVNTVTGIPYKEDKAILAWELGNELRDAPLHWIAEMAAYVKSIDKQHLLNDGIQGSTIADGVLLLEDIDLLSSHHYEHNPDEMIANIKTCLNQARGKKPYFIGEFGFISTSAIHAVLDLVQQNSSIAGALIWSLRFHNRDGGFYWHSEPMGSGLYKAYHWPGFISGHAYDERSLMYLMRQFAYRIDNQSVPQIPAPEVPLLLPINDVGAISWQGSAGAEYYTLERAESAQGPWEIIASHICDADVAYAPLYADKDVKIGSLYFYRVRASNFSGVSRPSNVIGPVKVNHLTLVDEMQNLAVLYHYSGSVSIESREARRFKEDFHRLRGQRGTSIIYRIPSALSGFNIYYFSTDDRDDLDISVSVDGEEYHPVAVQNKNYFSGELDYGYAYPFLIKGEISDRNIQYLKIDFLDECQIGRVEVRYGN